MTGTSPPGPLRCGSTTCSVNAVATAASNALPPRSRIPMPTAVAIQWVEVTTPNVPSISGRVVKVFGLMLVIKCLLLLSDIWAVSGLRRRPYCVVLGQRIETNVPGRAGGLKGRESALSREPLKVGLAGLGAVGLNVAQRIEAGIPGLVLAAVSVRDKEKARRNLPQAGNGIPVLPAEELAQTCDVVVECLPPALFRTVAVPAIERGRIFVPLSVGQLLQNWDLVTRAKQSGARILVPTGALIGLDAVRAAAEGIIRSVTMITRKPPGGLDGAPYLVQRGISVKNLKEPLKVFDGTAREGARGFPEHVNVAAGVRPVGHR